MSSATGDLSRPPAELTRATSGRRAGIGTKVLPGTLGLPYSSDPARDSLWGVKENLRIGRIAGIPVGINWSVLVIVALVTQVLAAGVFPDEVKGYPTGAYWGVSAAVAILFFLSLAAHETAHALVARRYGVKIERITLWMLGGVTVLEGEPPTPRADLRVAGAGPATSAAAGLVFLLAGSVARGLSGPELLTAGFVWLGGMNLLLAVFNLLPAAPLDGGRILRALLWGRGRTRTAAAVTAARAGRVVGAGLLGLGLAELLLLDAVGGLWLMLLGWFILASAGQEEHTTVLRDKLGDLRMRDVMTADPVCGPAYFPVATFIERIALTHHHTAYPVVDFEGHVAGLVTLQQLASVRQTARESVRVSDVATPRQLLRTAAPGDRVVDVLAQPQALFGQRRILVFEGELLVGIVSSSDVAHLLQEAALRGSATGTKVPEQFTGPVQPHSPVGR